MTNCNTMKSTSLKSTSTYTQFKVKVYCNYRQTISVSVELLANKFKYQEYMSLCVDMCMHHRHHPKHLLRIDLEPMLPGSQCFLRRSLQYPGMPTIVRGESGTIVRVDGSEATVQFAHGTVRIYDVRCLEPAPGTFSRGFAALTSIPYGVYATGMMCSD